MWAEVGSSAVGVDFAIAKSHGTRCAENGNGLIAMVRVNYCTFVHETTLSSADLPDSLMLGEVQHCQWIHMMHRQKNKCLRNSINTASPRAYSDCTLRAIPLVNKLKNVSGVMSPCFCAQYSTDFTPT